MRPPSRTSSTIIITVQVECQQVVDNLGRSGSYTGSLDRETQLPHGQGRMEYCDSTVTDKADDHDRKETRVSSYDGQWFQGDWSGYGKFCCQRYIYEGSFLDNYRHGLGVIKYKADGRFYDGFFRFGEIAGKGKMRYSDGSVYWGCCSKEDELPHGRGKLTKSDGTVYDGEFQSGRFQGHGRITFPDGSWYLGEFTDGIPNGLGLEVGSDGSVCHEGTFFNGSPVRSSSFPQQRHSCGRQLLYKTRSCGRGRALVGPLPRQLGMRNLIRSASLKL